jgi:tRNA pseudouridine55 synthase
MNGIINIFKPKGMTSHDVVSIMRRTLRIKKIGHTGTLDPNATGVLPLCIGKATRISEYLLDVDKEYIGELSLGLSTDTQDGEGKIINYSTKLVKEDDIYKTFDRFQGKIEQLPPMYSALKHNGKKLYELAREGKTVNRKPRNVYIYSLKIIDIIDNRKVLFYVKCSRGTYIRTLCNDIGEFLGTYGYMSYLIRVGVGDFKISDSYSIDYINGLDKEGIKSIICSMDKGLSHMNSLIVEEKYFVSLINGVLVPLSKGNFKGYENSILKIYCNDIFIGLGRIIKKDNMPHLKMDKVLV